MALSLPRWMVVAALACGAVVVALLPPEPRDLREIWRSPIQATRLVRLTARLDQAKQQLAMAEQGEEVSRRVRTQPLPGGAAPVVIDVGAATRDQRASFATRLEGAWPEVPLNDSIALGMVLGGDSTNMVWLSGYLLPSDTDGRSCVTLIRTATWLRPEWVEGGLARQVMREAAPCLFFDIYGKPGPSVEHWMNGKGLDFATYFNPEAQPDQDTSGPEGNPFLMYQLEWEAYGMMPSARRCLNSDLPSCRTSLALPSADTNQPDPIAGFRTATYPWRAAFGITTGSFLSDLHRQIGPEAFGKFWRSERPFEHAFAEASGMDLGQWTHEWALGRRPAFRPGPLPQQRSVVRIAGITMLLLGVVLTLSSRRTVT